MRLAHQFSAITAASAFAASVVVVDGIDDDADQLDECESKYASLMLLFTIDLNAKSMFYFCIFREQKTNKKSWQVIKNLRHLHTSHVITSRNAAARFCPVYCCSSIRKGRK